MFLIISFIVLIIWLVLQKLNRPKGKTLHNLQGPKGWPIIGNAIMAIQSSDALFRTVRSFAKDYYPVYKFTRPTETVLAIVNANDAEIVLSNTKHNTKAEFYNFLHMWLGTGLLTSTGNKWQSRRKTLTPTFHFSILRGFIDIFYKESLTLVADLEKTCHKDYIDITEPISNFTLNSIIDTAMGTSLKVPPKDKQKYKEAVHTLGDVLQHRLMRFYLHPEYFFQLSKKYKEAVHKVSILHNFRSSVIEQRKKQIVEDKIESKIEKPVEGSSYSTRKRLAMLDLLLMSQENENNIDDAGIAEEVDTFMFEGHDTTSVGLCFILMLLANHPNHQQTIYDEIMEVLGEKTIPKYETLQELHFMERSIKESLRLYPSVPYIARTSGEDFTTNNGYLVPKNTLLEVHIYDVHRDPKYYPDPEKFDPDRFLPENLQDRHPFAYIPFSAGPRNCIGQKFAMLEIKTVLCEILRNFELVAVDKPEDMIFIIDLVLRTKNGIKVKFVRRKK